MAPKAIRIETRPPSAARVEQIAETVGAERMLQARVHVRLREVHRIRVVRRDDRNDQAVQDHQDEDHCRDHSAFVADVQPLRPRGTDVVLLERLEHRAAHEPREEGHRREPERDRRQDLVLPRGPAARREARFTRLQREEIDQERREQEARARRGRCSRRSSRRNRPPCCAAGGDHPERDPDDDREEKRVDPAHRVREVRPDDVVDVAAAHDTSDGPKSNVATPSST